MLVLRFLVFWVVTLISRVFYYCMSKECQESTTMLLSISTQKTSMLGKMCWEVQPFGVDLPTILFFIEQFQIHILI